MCVEGSSRDHRSAEPPAAAAVARVAVLFCVGQTYGGTKDQRRHPYLLRITAVVLVLSLMRLLVTTSVRRIHAF